MLSEELATVKAKLADISTLESAEQTAEERLRYVRACLRDSKVCSSFLVHLHLFTLCRGERGEERGGWEGEERDFNFIGMKITTMAWSSYLSLLIYFSKQIFHT